MTIAIFDDDITAIDVMADICLNAYPESHIVGKATTIREAQKIINREKPELIFMDVEFPEGTGFDVLESILEYPFQLIFVTAHSDYAISAIEHEAIGYVLKPIKEQEVLDAMERAIRRLKKGQVHTGSSMVNMAKASMAHRLAIPISDGHRYVNIDDIVYLKSDYGYTDVYLSSGEKITVSKKLSWFEKQLETETFLRVHRSFLVNKYHITEVHRKDGGYLCTTLGNRINVSRGFTLKS